MKNDKQREYETTKKLIENEKNAETRAILVSRALKLLNEMGTK